MRSALATVVFVACIPLVLAGAVCLVAGLGVGWFAIQIAPSGAAWQDAFDVPVPPL